ncbi:Protein Mis18-alpha, partial [Dissostichus eleginoides]
HPQRRAPGNSCVIKLEESEGGTVALISLCKYEPADLGVWRGLIALSVDSVEQRIVGQKLRPLGSCQSA